MKLALLIGLLMGAWWAREPRRSAERFELEFYRGFFKRLADG